MAASSWKGYITFGLVSIPVSLTPAARTERISFNQLHSVCHTRLKQPLSCPHCERMVDRSEVEKGYEYEKDQYLLFSPSDLKSVEPESTRSMTILEFVKLDEIDPLYFDASYYVAPEEAGTHAYGLLVSALRKTGFAGIAKATMHNREYTVVIRARKNGLTLHTMFYPNEIRAANAPELKDAGQNKAQEEALAIQLIKSLAAPFQPDKYRDTYQAGVEKLIEAKSHGKTIANVPQRKMAPVIDLMAALKKSLNESTHSRGSKTLLASVPKKEDAGKRRRKAS